jgi:hypothetical protein
MDNKRKVIATTSMALVAQQAWLTAIEILQQEAKQVREEINGLSTATNSHVKQPT